jgi:6-pyruvoyltetrahydropterin/6-carboxytetrahydropterin synthase
MAAFEAYSVRMVDIVFKRRFSMAHRLRFDRTSKCATPHGHNEFVSVTLRLKQGCARNIDWGGSNHAESFARLKKHWHRFVDESLDHALQLGHDDPLIAYFQAHEPDIVPRLLVINGDPTTEAVAMALYFKLNAILSAYVPDFECIRFEIEETPTNSVVIALDEMQSCTASLGAWCGRADMSINDLLAPESWADLDI